jgi:hypothetical protein
VKLQPFAFFILALHGDELQTPTALPSDKYSLDRTLGGPCSRSSRSDEEENLCPCWESGPSRRGQLFSLLTQLSIRKQNMETLSCHDNLTNIIPILEKPGVRKAEIYLYLIPHMTRQSLHFFSLVRQYYALLLTILLYLQRLVQVPVVIIFRLKKFGGHVVKI